MITTTDNPELLAVRLLKKRLLEQRIAAIRNDGLPYYQPHSKQDAFHRAGVFSRRRMARGGNRSGKSTLGCAEDCAWLRRERPWYAEGDPARRGGIPQQPIKLLTITTDWDKVDEIFTSQRGEGGKAWRYLPRDGFVKSTKRNHSGAIDTIECSNGSLWRFDTVKSWMANPQSSESSDWDAIHVDEPCPEGMWKGASRGLMDRGGSAWFTLTPLIEWWINDYFFPQDTGGLLRPGVWATTMSTYDNPALLPSDIADYESTLSEEEKQCRIHGLPLHLAGLIYKEFSWDKHVLKTVPEGWEDFNRPPKSWPVYFAIDPHPQTPHAVLLATVSPHGVRVYFDDIFKHCTIEDLAAEIRSRTDGYYVPIARMDPLGFIKDPITDSCFADELAKCRVYVEKATKDLHGGIIKVKSELAKENGIRFTPTCKRTLWEIQRYCWDQRPDHLNKPVDKDDHMVENLYRLELEGMRWLERTVEMPSLPELDFGQTQLNLEELDLEAV